MLCAKCNSKVARDAYYCKKCGEVVDDAIAPGLKVEDKRFSSRFIYALEIHLIRNVVVAVILILFAATGIKLGLNYLHTVKDNGSSKVLQLTVETPQNPMTCVGSICHLLIDIKNKSAQVEKINTIPDLVSSSGAKFGPADPSRMGNGVNYCQSKIVITLAAHEIKKYLGVCSQDIPSGTKMVLVELRGSDDKLLVSGPFNALVP